MAKAETRLNASQLLEHDFLTMYAPEDDASGGADPLFPFEKEGSGGVNVRIESGDVAFPEEAHEEFPEHVAKPPLLAMTNLLRDFKGEISTKWEKTMDTTELLHELKERNDGFLSQRRLRMVAEQQPRTIHDLQCMLDPRVMQQRNAGISARCKEVIEIIKIHHDNKQHSRGKRVKEATTEILNSAVELLAIFCEEQYTEDHYDDEHPVGHQSARARVIDLISGKGSSKSKAGNQIERSGIFVTALVLLKFPKAGKEDTGNAEDSVLKLNMLKKRTEDDGDNGDDPDDPDADGSGDASNTGLTVASDLMAAAATALSRSSSPALIESDGDPVGSDDDEAVSAAAACTADAESVYPKHFWGTFLRKSADLTEAPHKLWQTMKEFNDIIDELTMLVAPMTHTPKRRTTVLAGEMERTHSNYLDNIGRLDSTYTASDVGSNYSGGGAGFAHHGPHHGSHHGAHHSGAATHPSNVSAVQMDSMMKEMRTMQTKLDQLLNMPPAASAATIAHAVVSAAGGGVGGGIDALRSPSSPIPDGNALAAGAAPKPAVGATATAVTAAAPKGHGAPKKVVSFAAVTLAAIDTAPAQTAAPAPTPAIPPALAPLSAPSGRIPAPSQAISPSNTILTVVGKLLSRPQLHQKLAAYIVSMGMSDELFVKQSTENVQLHDIALAMIELHPEDANGESADEDGAVENVTFGNELEIEELNSPVSYVSSDVAVGFSFDVAEVEPAPTAAVSTETGGRGAPPPGHDEQTGPEKIAPAPSSSSLAIESPKKKRLSPQKPITPTRRLSGV